MARPHRPKGAWSDKAWRDAIRVAVTRAADDPKKHGKKLAQLADALVNAGCQGDVSALKEIGDRLDGKAKQQIEATITDKRMVVEAPAISSDSDAWERQYGRPN